MSFGIGFDPLDGDDALEYFIFEEVTKDDDDNDNCNGNFDEDED